ncbi:hypothetical protein QBC32DRAFT_314993 [Pseudoneurospora amorphoporcata]|uniref:Heterokaryon incompatibility domain-containing protein n=1 Tax=Pseudoneurospora amorphoporcata TaxID=241081 RepID=A0AAN6NUL3_9PEZI|nr:hypothetical protein QBC32DRAFT_314993 [Pseudoneurospora amorphoporcata]
MSQKKEASAIYIRTRKMAMGIAKLCWASYWRRVWIIQEFVMANDYVILCGNYFVKKRRFEEVLELTVTELVARGQAYCSWVGFQEDDHPTHRTFWSPAFEMIKLRETRLKGVTTTLAEWMRLCVMNDFRATDPRDYVYALLGISNDCTGMITPDYTKAVKDVFKRTVGVVCYHQKYEDLCGKRDALT